MRPFRIPFPIALLLISAIMLFESGCFRDSKVVKRAEHQANQKSANAGENSANNLPIQLWGTVEDLEKNLAVFESVFWEPRDTISMRKLIRESELVSGKKVLEIGTGSGLISLCCLAAGADSAVATDVNKNAIQCAQYNACQLGFGASLEARLVSLNDSSAYAVIDEGEKFDLIFSNPPWENDVPDSISEFALYDPGFQLIDSMMKELPRHLNNEGKLYLAYGCVSAIKEIQRLGKKYDLYVNVLDDRKLDELDEVFLPGMMLEVSLPKSKTGE